MRTATRLRPEIAAMAMSALHLPAPPDQRRADGSPRNAGAD
ncbi:hypothetical protein ACFU44_16340 [Nocardia rhizosphaerihabitans]